MKKIFDVNSLDLTKVGKAFGFSVPPRVNVNIGGGKGGTGRSGVKRRREDDGEVDGEDGSDDGGDAGEGESEDEGAQNRSRRKGKDRRIETLGKKKVDKEVYKKTISRSGPQGQWSR